MPRGILQNSKGNAGRMGSVLKISMCGVTLRATNGMEPLGSRFGGGRVVHDGICWPVGALWLLLFCSAPVWCPVLFLRSWKPPLWPVVFWCDAGSSTKVLLAPSFHPQNMGHPSNATGTVCVSLRHPLICFLWWPVDLEGPRKDQGILQQLGQLGLGG